MPTHTNETGVSVLHFFPEKKHTIEEVYMIADINIVYIFRQDHGRWMWMAVLVGPLMRFLYITTGRVVCMNGDASRALSLASELKIITAM